MDDDVKHIFREHNQEADHLANLGTEEQKHITVEGVKSTEAWKAIPGNWDGSKKEDGRGGCGIVIQARRQRKTGSQSAKLQCRQKYARPRLRRLQGPAV